MATESVSFQTWKDGYDTGSCQYISFLFVNMLFKYGN